MSFTSYWLRNVYDYYPYGKILRTFSDGTSEKYLTTQHERDTETGLDYRFARFYDSDLGRFLGVDPLASEFPNWSSYHYAYNNPINFTDPSGLEPENCTETDDKTEVEEEKWNGGWTETTQSLLDGSWYDGSGDSEEENSSDGGDDPLKITAPPKHTNSFDGLWGSVYYYFSGGHLDGSEYDSDGNYLRPSPNMGMPPSFIGGPLRKGQCALKLGKYLFNPSHFHNTVKPQVLKQAGNFVKVDGSNPDIKLKGTNIILTGSKNGPFVGKSYETGLSILDFIF